MSSRRISTSRSGYSGKALINIIDAAEASFYLLVLSTIYHSLRTHATCVDAA
jgi:hypothetical protein